MVRNSFYIKSERLPEMKNFIKDNLKSARFTQNPYQVGSEYHITLDMDVLDCNRLNNLFNKWYEIDHTPKTKESIIKRLIKLIGI